MDITVQPKLTFRGVDIINIQFSASAPSHNSTVDVNIECNPGVFFPKEDARVFHVIMDMKIDSENYFELEVRAVGKFELSTDMTEELKKTFINTNAPAIMFPYIRSFITTLTANMGSVRTLVIPTQFFNGSLEEVE